MKFGVSVFLTAIFAYALGLYLDWWSIAIAAFIVAVCIRQRPGFAWLSGFAGVLLLWEGYSIFLNVRNAGLLAGKVAQLLPVGGNVALLIQITGLAGALTGGFAALTGSYLHPRSPAFKKSTPLPQKAVSATQTAL